MRCRGGPSVLRGGRLALGGSRIVRIGVGIAVRTLLVSVQVIVQPLSNLAFVAGSGQVVFLSVLLERSDRELPDG